MVWRGARRPPGGMTVYQKRPPPHSQERPGAGRVEIFRRLAQKTREKARRRAEVFPDAAPSGRSLEGGRSSK